MTPSTKKWAWGIGLATVVVAGYFTKDHWMPFFQGKKVATTPPTTKPMANVTVATSKAPVTDETKQKSGFAGKSDLYYPKGSSKLYYPKGKSNMSGSNLDNQAHFDGGRFSVVELSNAGNGNIGIATSGTGKP